MTFMKWKDYKAAVQKGSGARWELLQTRDLVLGGLLLSLDFMCEFLFFRGDGIF